MSFILRLMSRGKWRNRRNSNKEGGKNILLRLVPSLEDPPEQRPRQPGCDIFACVGIKLSWQEYCVAISLFDIGWKVLIYIYHIFSILQLWADSLEYKVNSDKREDLFHLHFYWTMSILNHHKLGSLSSVKTTQNIHI